MPFQPGKQIYTLADGSIGDAGIYPCECPVECQEYAKNRAPR